VKELLGALLLITAGYADAAPLTVRTGESWVFTIRNGEPANARKVAASVKPASGQVMVTVRAVMGTMMVITNNSAVAYNFRAELLSGGKALSARSCTLPANARPALEQWPQKADAVRISKFRPAAKDGSCP
jgi:hypothetical protein